LKKTSFRTDLQERCLEGFVGILNDIYNQECALLSFDKLGKIATKHLLFGLTSQPIMQIYDEIVHKEDLLNECKSRFADIISDINNGYCELVRNIDDSNKFIQCCSQKILICSKNPFTNSEALQSIGNELKEFEMKTKEMNAIITVKMVSININKHLNDTSDKIITLQKSLEETLSASIKKTMSSLREQIDSTLQAIDIKIQSLKDVRHYREAYDAFNKTNPKQLILQIENAIKQHKCIEDITTFKEDISKIETIYCNLNQEVTTNIQMLEINAKIEISSIESNLQSLENSILSFLSTECALPFNVKFENIKQDILNSINKITSIESNINLINPNLCKYNITSIKSHIGSLNEMISVSEKYITAQFKWKDINKILSETKFYDVDFGSLHNIYCSILSLSYESISNNTIKITINAFITMVQASFAKMSLIFKLGKSKLKSKHWMIIANELKSTQLLQPEFTCSDVINSGINLISLEIENIIRESTIEQDLEKEIMRITLTLSSMQFIIAKSQDYNVISNFEQILNSLSKEDAALDVMSQIAEDTQNKVAIKTLRNDILKYESRAMMWAQSQKKWFEIKGIMKRDKISIQLLAEYNSFKIGEEKLLHINQCLLDNCHIQFQLGDWRLEEIQTIFELFELAENAVTAYIDTRRYSFPRYYFLSTKELLAISNEYSEQNMIKSNISSLFDGARYIYYSDKITKLPKPSCLEEHELVYTLLE